MSNIHEPSMGPGESVSGEAGLLPCPFYGGQADPKGWLGHNSKGHVESGPECDGCGVTAPSVEVWNTRTLPTTPDQANEQ